MEEQEEPLTHLSCSRDHRSPPTQASSSRYTHLESLKVPYNLQRSSLFYCERTSAHPVTKKNTKIWKEFQKR